MGKIIYIMGKSSSGKDTIFRNLLTEKSLHLMQIVPYTTRPIRVGEENGQEYFFTDEAGFQKLKSENMVIEDRAYQTYHGLWRYFTVNDKQMDLSKNDYIIIGTLESYTKTRDFFGSDVMLPVLIDLDDGVRLQRALNREKKQSQPKYEELCRRFLADSEDFSEENIKAAGIVARFYNEKLSHCTKEIVEYIRANTK